MYSTDSPEVAKRIEENLLILKKSAGWDVVKKALNQEKERLENKILNETSSEYNKTYYTESDLDKQRRAAVMTLVYYPDYIIEQMSLDVSSDSQDDPYITSHKESA